MPAALVPTTLLYTLYSVLYNCTLHSNPQTHKIQVIVKRRRAAAAQRVQLSGSSFNPAFDMGRAADATATGEGRYCLHVCVCCGGEPTGGSSVGGPLDTFGALPLPAPGNAGCPAPLLPPTPQSAWTARLPRQSWLATWRLRVSRQAPSHRRKAVPLLLFLLLGGWRCLCLYSSRRWHQQLWTSHPPSHSAADAPLGSSIASFNQSQHP